MFGYEIVDTSKNVVVPKAEFPAFEKAHKLARCLSLNDIEMVLSGEKGLHKNPGKRKAVEPESPVIIGKCSATGTGLSAATPPHTDLGDVLITAVILDAVTTHHGVERDIAPVSP